MRAPRTRRSLPSGAAPAAAWLPQATPARQAISRARRVSFARQGFDAVANPRLSNDQCRPHRVHLQLAAKAADVNTEILLGIAVRIAPHGGEQLPVRHRAPGVLEQGTQQLPLGLGEMDARAGA